MSPEVDLERRYAVTAEHVSLFQRDLAAVGPQQIHPLPNLIPYIKHNSKYTRPEVDVLNGMSLDFDILTEAGAENPTDIQSQLFFLKPAHRIGRENSHNKVFFGLMLSSSSNQGVEATGVDVAVKTKELKRRDALLGELAMFQYMQSLGIPTFRPYGLLKSSHSYHLLTVTDQPVDTMDTIDWRELDLDERWAKMDFAIGTLSMLHSAMLFHGDAEFKNIAFGEMGEIVVVDPELMVSSIDLAYICSGDFPPDEQQRAALRIKQSMSKDFTDLTNSVQAQLFKGLPERQRPGSEAALFKEMKRNVITHIELLYIVVTLLSKMYSCALLK